MHAKFTNAQRNAWGVTPDVGEGVVLLHAAALLEHGSQVQLRRGVPLLREAPVPAHGLLDVRRLPPAAAAVVAVASAVAEAEAAAPAAVDVRVGAGVGGRVVQVVVVVVVVDAATAR